jgi:hypothetical protein
MYVLRKSVPAPNNATRVPVTTINWLPLVQRRPMRNVLYRTDGHESETPPTAGPPPPPSPAPTIAWRVWLDLLPPDKRKDCNEWWTGQTDAVAYFKAPHRFFSRRSFLETRYHCRFMVFPSAFRRRHSLNKLRQRPSKFLPSQNTKSFSRCIIIWTEVKRQQESTKWSHNWPKLVTVT